MLATMNDRKILFRTSDVTAREIYSRQKCCAARRNCCDGFGDITEGKLAVVKHPYMSACGDTNAVTILLQDQHMEITQHGSGGKHQDGGHV